MENVGDYATTENMEAPQGWTSYLSSSSSSFFFFFLEKGKEERSGKTEPAENDWLVCKGRLRWRRANPANDDRKTLKYVPKNGAGKEGEICRTSMQYKTDQTETEGNYRIMKGCGHFRIMRGCGMKRGKGRSVDWETKTK